MTGKKYRQNTLGWCSGGIALLLSIILTWVASSAHASEWPQVRATEATVGFTYGAPFFSMVLPIYSVDGKRLYTFGCLGGNLGYLDRFSDRTGVDVVGPVMCTLGQGPDWEGGGLLTEDAYDSGKPWFTRGYFSPELFEAFDRCRDYPDYGAHRTFRLRGIRLDIVIRRPEYNDPAFDEFEMSVSVKNDPTAVTVSAEPSVYRNPFAKGGDCRKVEAGVEALLSPETLVRIPEKFFHLPPLTVAGVLGEEVGGVRLYTDTQTLGSIYYRLDSSLMGKDGIAIIWPQGMDLPKSCYGKAVVIGRAVFEQTENGKPVLRIPNTLREIREVATNTVCWSHKSRSKE